MSLSTKWNAFREMMKMDNGIGLVVSRLIFPRRKVQICRFKGLEFVTDLSKGDANGARSVLATDEYRKFLGFMDLPEGINVLDLGANNGGFPLLLASEGRTFRKLVCVEFNPDTFERLQQNLEMNFGKEFAAINAAVNGSGEPVSLSGDETGTGANIYQGIEGGATVEGATVDEIVRRGFGSEEIDICKIDVEGAEFEILLGQHSTLINRCRYILIEIHHFPDNPRELVIERLGELGFEEAGPDRYSDDFHHVHLFRRCGA